MLVWWVCGMQAKSKMEQVTASTARADVVWNTLTNASYPGDQSLYKGF